MHSDENLTDRILSSLAGLTVEAQAAAVIALIGVSVKTMSVCRLLQIRDEITRDLDVNLAVVRDALDVIEGQLALREIAGDADWR